MKRAPSVAARRSPEASAPNVDRRVVSLLARLERELGAMETAARAILAGRADQVRQAAA